MDFLDFPICSFSLQGGCLRTQGPALQLPAKQFLLRIMIIMIPIIMITIVMIKSREHYHELQKSSLASTLLDVSVESHYLFKSILFVKQFC